LDTKTIATQVLEFLQRNPACTFDQLAKDCGEFTWTQLFYEVDRLRQLGQLSLMEVGFGRCHLSLSPKEESHETLLISDLSSTSRSLLLTQHLTPEI
jgi:hypothetical protein